jgi:hypothetical protein
VYNPTLSIGFLCLCSAIAYPKTVDLVLGLFSCTFFPRPVASLAMALALAFMLTSYCTGARIAKIWQSLSLLADS